MCNRFVSEDIVNGLKEDKEKYYQDLTIEHTTLINAFTSIMDLIEISERGRVFLVYGPSGVGKSTLLNKIQNKLEEENQELMELNKGVIPVVSFEVSSEGSGKFNWIDFYRRFLTSIEEPLINEKVSTYQLLKKQPNKKLPYYLPETARELRESLENALIYRKVKIALLDEAQHFLKISQSRSLYDHMDALKSLANLTGTIFILFGTFDLRKFLNINGQLTRRTVDIYFPRYDVTKKADRETFARVVELFQNHMPFKRTYPLIDHFDYLYDRSVGCVGVLRDWLFLCVQRAIYEDMESISFKLLKRYAPSAKNAFEMGKEAILNEEEMRESTKTNEDLRKLLVEKINIDEVHSQTSKKKRGTNNPGKRKEIRDSIGIKDEKKE